MKVQSLTQLIKMDNFSITPKYLQIVNSIITGIENGKIKLGTFLPSINEMSSELDLSRDTVEKGYKRLKEIGIIDAIPRQGYYISNIEYRQKFKICLLFNKLSAHKKIIYDSFVAKISEHTMIDFYIYNNDLLLFKSLISKRKEEEYTHYVVIPHFMDADESATECLNLLPKEKLLLLDKKVEGITGEYFSVVENFEKDIYQALLLASEVLSKYHTLKIIFPSHTYYPLEIVKGFKNFCQDYAFGYEIIDSIEQREIEIGVVYINVLEDDLVALLDKIIASGLKIGEQVGIISYNETNLKRFILNGITTISTDFHLMGLKAAEFILSDTKQSIEIPFKLTLRNSL
jgi:DNA-binding transcriptional regulator YhcF (GntR family)